MEVDEKIKYVCCVISGVVIQLLGGWDVWLLSRLPAVRTRPRTPKRAEIVRFWHVFFFWKLFPKFTDYA